MTNKEIEEITTDAIELQQMDFSSFLYCTELLVFVCLFVCVL